jgi:hypothetical protein
MKKHKLVLVGFLSSYVAYLDISEEEASRRYAEENLDFPICRIKTIEFDESFEVYDAYEIEED